MAAEFYRDFGRRLCKARAAAGLSQADLAMAIRLTRTSVTNIEKGRQKVLLHTFREILKVLNVDADELLDTKRESSVPASSLSNLPSDERTFVERALGRTAKEDYGDSSEADSSEGKGATDTMRS